MTETTGRDEYECKLSIIEGKRISEDLDKGCGGVVVFTENKRIMCNNTLYARLNLSREESLPVIRATLFPTSLSTK